MAGEVDLDVWFCKEVLPLERSLLAYLRRNWRGLDDVHDLLHDIYVAALTSAQHALPIRPRNYVFTIARNHMIQRAQRSRIVSIETVAELENMDMSLDMFATDRLFSARDELRRAQAGIERLPPRCREVVYLRKVEGLSTKEAAQRLGVGVDAIEQQMVRGMRALTDFMLGEGDKGCTHSEPHPTTREQAR